MGFWESCEQFAALGFCVECIWAMGCWEGCEQFAAVGFCEESVWILGCLRRGGRGCEQFAAVGFVENPSGVWAAGAILKGL